MIELHCHTTASDGTYTPERLVEHAFELGITHLAITDHDSTAALDPAARACADRGIRLIPGVELSTSYKGRPMDILGYGFDPDAPVLKRALADMIDKRNARTPKIVARLQEEGVPIALEDVLQAASGDAVGRPHIARALVNRGVVASVQEAFERYIGRGCPAYVPKEVFQPGEAIGVIREAGGIAVLAHPRFLKFTEGEFEALLDFLTGAGLGGIEAYYSQHSREEAERFAAAAAKRGLVATGGSDFHGENKPDIPLGIGPEGQPLPERIAEELIVAIERRHSA